MPDPTSGLPFGEAEELFHRALDLNPEARAAHLAVWCSGDTRLLDEVRSLLAAYDGCEADGILPADVADPWMGRDLGVWRIEQLLGRGGAGSVYLAARSDGEFRMQAAVKVLSDRLASVATRDRFELERQILASLNHPHIALLIDGGVTPQGEAYLVMEYVEGEPLDVWATRCRPGVHELLGVFRQVLSAVEHAHRNLILHRDLKPSNILMTPDGHAKVLDFGNAKLLDDGTGDGARRMTQLGRRAFTPEFAAPEQVLGGAISAACDVYSLGVVLYGLLAGRPPYRFETQSSAEFVHVLRDFDPLPPGAPGDLDAIVMKAMHKEAIHRYPTIAAFAADLCAFLESRPVSAREPTLLYRTRRFVARRRGAVTAAALAAILIVAGVTGIAWQAHRARVEEQRAYAQFRTARELAHALLFDFYDAVQELPGSLDVQRELVSQSIRYVDRLWRESPGDSDAAIDMIEANLRMGNLQGNPYSDNLSDVEGAVRTLESARLVAAGMTRAEPRNARAQRLLGLTEQALGEVYFGKRDIAAAAGHLEGGVRALEAAAALPPETAVALLEAASVCGSLGDVYSGGNGAGTDMARAEALFRKQQALDQRALTVEPSNERAARGVAIAEMKIARLISEERPSEAIRLLESATQHLSAMPEAARHNMSNLRLEASIRTRLGGLLSSLGSYDAGKEHVRQALRLYESAAALAPGNNRAQTDLLQAWFYYAESLDYDNGGAAGVEDARKSYRAALGVCNTLMQGAPENTLWKSRAAELEFRIGRLSVALHDQAGANAALRHARDLATDTADRPDAGETELARAAIQFSSEQVPAAWRDLPRAQHYMERALAEAAAPSPHNFATMAVIFRQQGRIAEALDWIARADALLLTAERQATQNDGPSHGPGQPKSYLRRQIEDEKQAINEAAAKLARQSRSTPQK